MDQIGADSDKDFATILSLANDINAAIRASTSASSAINQMPVTATTSYDHGTDISSPTPAVACSTDLTKDDSFCLAGIANHFHPDAVDIPAQNLSSRTLQFQDMWFQEYSRLHYSPGLQAVVCYFCAKAYCETAKVPGAKNGYPAFVNRGFTNWKKVQKF